MTKSTELFLKAKIFHERHNKIFQKYATPYPLTTRTNWLLRYEKIKAREKQREDARNQNNLSNNKEKKSDENVIKSGEATVVTLISDKGTAMNTISVMGTEPYVPIETMGAIDLIKFLDIW